MRLATRDNRKQAEAEQGASLRRNVALKAIRAVRAREAMHIGIVPGKRWSVQERVLIPAEVG
jgi:hypothetical protein